MINLFLDDLRPCPKGYQLARSVKACIRLLHNNDVGVLSLDYNLGTGKPKGDAVVRYMIRHKQYPRCIIIHTATRSGRLRMVHALKKHKPDDVKLFVRPKAPFKRGLNHSKQA